MDSDKNTRPQVWKYFASSLLLENRTGITEKKNETAPMELFNRINLANCFYIRLSAESGCIPGLG